MSCRTEIQRQDGVICSWNFLHLLQVPCLAGVRQMLATQDRHHLKEARTACPSHPSHALHTVGVCAQSLSRVRLFVTPWTAAHQALPSMGFLRQKYWSRLPCCHPGDLPNPGIEPTSLESLALAGGFLIPRTTWQMSNNEF